MYILFCWLGRSKLIDVYEQTLPQLQASILSQWEELIKDIPNKLKEDTEDVNNNQEASELPENINKLVEFMKVIILKFLDKKSKLKKTI